MPNGLSLENLLSREFVAPLVYTYPPRSAYLAGEAPASFKEIWAEDLRHSNRDLNLYIHIPFCRYRCGFCNLYTIVGVPSDDVTAYVDAIIRQLYDSSEIIQERMLRTINIGGGTPSLLSISHFARIVDALTDIYPNWRSVVDEVATEASPDSVAGREGAAYLSELRGLGFTRLNLGIQSLDDRELRNSGRASANSMAVRSAVEAVRRAEIPNFSTDLIIGFAGQTDSAWDASVAELISFRPETISTYLLTIRPDAWFARTGLYEKHGDSALYRRYERARDALFAAGYVYDSNVRYKLPGRGGLLQKVLQFRGVPVLGIGAGARSYTNTVDYIVGGSNRPSPAQVRDFVSCAAENRIVAKAGFVFDDEERIRKRLVLDLFDLHLGELDRFGFNGRRHEFMPLLTAAVDAGLLKERGRDHYYLTIKGYQYRDILSMLFFSSRVKQRDERFYTRIKETSASEEL